MEENIIIEKVKSSLIKGNLNESLNDLLYLVNERGDEKLERATISLMNRCNVLKYKYNTQTIDIELYSLQHRKLTKSILGLLNEVRDKIAHSEINEKKEDTSKVSITIEVDSDLNMQKQTELLEALENLLKLPDNNNIIIKKISRG